MPVSRVLRVTRGIKDRDPQFLALYFARDIDPIRAFAPDRGRLLLIHCMLREIAGRAVAVAILQRERVELATEHSRSWTGVAK